MNRSSILVLAAALAFPGCVAVAVGAAAGYGTAQYVRNADVRDYAGSLATVWSAALASMRDAGYPVADTAPASGAEAAVAVNDAAVSAREITAGTVRVSVKVGTFTSDAHRRTTGAIHDGIARRLAP